MLSPASTTSGFLILCLPALAQIPDWTKNSPTTSPSPRSRHGLAFDAARGRTIMFGGQNAAYEQLDDTWAWDGSTWTELKPKVSPPARSGHTMCLRLAAPATGPVRRIELDLGRDDLARYPGVRRDHLEADLHRDRALCAHHARHGLRRPPRSGGAVRRQHQAAASHVGVRWHHLDCHHAESPTAASSHSGWVGLRPQPQATRRGSRCSSPSIPRPRSRCSPKRSTSGGGAD